MLTREVKRARLRPGYEWAVALVLTLCGTAASVAGAFGLTALTGGFDVKTYAPRISLRAVESVSLPTEGYMSSLSYDDAPVRFRDLAFTDGNIRDLSLVATGNVVLGAHATDTTVINGTLLAGGLNVAQEIRDLKTRCK